jgi:biopolymer transport protein ExbD
VKSIFGKVSPSISGASGGTFRPQLTSLIDVMTILLVFLIKNMAVEGQLITPSDDLELPVSSSEQPPRPAFMVEITKTAVVVAGEVLAETGAIAGADSLMIPPLYTWIAAVQQMKADSALEREVLIQCDREVEFDIVKRVMFTCSKAGFSDFSVLALEEE